MELDAIPPENLRGLVRASIERHMDTRRLEVLKHALAKHQEIERALEQEFAVVDGEREAMRR